MCGIVGFFSAERPISPELLARSTHSLRHRGPNGQRQWVSASGRVGLGHARLAIIDLENGAQPLTNEDEQLHVVVNGEFYDFERIRADLEARGHHFRSGSDSEIVLHLYEEYGAQCVHHLRGEFAFLLWDARRQRLLAARDRFGIKPLFYAQIDGMLAFASEIKGASATSSSTRCGSWTLGSQRVAEALRLLEFASQVVEPLAVFRLGAAVEQGPGIARGVLDAGQFEHVDLASRLLEQVAQVQ